MFKVLFSKRLNLRTENGLKVSNSWRQTINQRGGGSVPHRTLHPRGTGAAAAYRLVALHQLVGGDGSVQAGFAHVDVSVLGEAGQQGQQRLRVHVVVVVHVAKPPKPASQSDRSQMAGSLVRTGTGSTSSDPPKAIMGLTHVVREHLNVSPFA